MVRSVRNTLLLVLVAALFFLVGATATLLLTSRDFSPTSPINRDGREERYRSNGNARAQVTPAEARPEPLASL
jgi:hypothetical protein